MDVLFNQIAIKELNNYQTFKDLTLNKMKKNKIKNYEDFLA